MISAHASCHPRAEDLEQNRQPNHDFLSRRNASTVDSRQIGSVADVAPLVATAIVHRVGVLGLGGASVAIGVSSAHRQDAFGAGKWLIDTLKEVVPIWKQENWADGTTEWVHPNETSPIEPSPTKQPIDKAE